VIQAAHQTIVRIYRQTEELCLQMLAESIRKAHKSGHNRWGLTHHKNDRVRLNVGKIVVCTLEAGGIWFALDKGFAGASDESYLDKALDCWTWSPEHNYREVSSISADTTSHRQSEGTRRRGRESSNCTLP
jgi:hypothetical protein